MTPVALLDVNVLLALFSPEHVHHDIAHDWFEDTGRAGWATCPLTENGFVRVVTQLGYAGTGIRPDRALDLLRQFCRAGGHHFWSDVLSLGDPAIFRSTHIAGHRQITDVYLLGLAKANGGCLATLDHAVPIAAVVGATPDHLQVIAG